VRVGCSGCLTTILILGLILMVGTSVWGTARALQDPALSAVSWTAQDAATAQGKLLRLVRGAAREPIVLSEAEVNAFVSRNVDPRDLPFDEPAVFLRDNDGVELLGHVPLRRVLAESPLVLLTDVLPHEWLEHPLWLRVVAHVAFEREPRRQLRLDIRRVTLGRQWMPTVALRLFFDPARLRLVRVPVAESIADVRVERGRAVIRPTSSRERT
jgi:hypothetical protein